MRARNGRRARTMLGSVTLRRTVLALAVVALLGLVTAGCGGDDDQESQQAGGKVTLSWWDYFGYSPESDAAMKDLIERYEAANPDVTIKRTAVAYPDFFTKLNQAVSSRKVPDILAIDQGTIPSYAAQGAFADLTQYTADWPTMDEFLPTVAETVEVDGKTYGVPFRSNALVLWFNQELLEEAGVGGPPKDWDELREQAKALTSSEHSGLCFPGNKTEASTFIYLTFLWGAGGDLEQLGDAGSVQALEYVSSLMSDGSVPKSVVQWSWEDLASQFASGNCAMMIAGPWVYGAVDKAKFKWDVAEVPAGPSGENPTPLGGEAWTVGATSKNVEAAWKLIEWLSEPENSAKQILEGTQSFPNRPDLEDHPAAEWSDIVPTVSSAIESARSRVKYGPKYNNISTIVANMFQQVLTGQRSPQEAADEAKAQIQPLLPQT